MAQPPARKKLARTPMTAKVIISIHPSIQYIGLVLEK